MSNRDLTLILIYCVWLLTVPPEIVYTTNNYVLNYFKSVFMFSWLLWSKHEIVLLCYLHTSLWHLPLYCLLPNFTMFFLSCTGLLNLSSKDRYKTHAFRPKILVLFWSSIRLNSLTTPFCHVRIYGMVCASHDLNLSRCSASSDMTLCRFNSYFLFLFELGLVIFWNVPSTSALYQCKGSSNITKFHPLSRQRRPTSTLVLEKVILVLFLEPLHQHNALASSPFLVPFSLTSPCFHGSVL